MAAGETSFRAVVALLSGSLASAVIRPCNCWRSDARGSLDETPPSDIVEPESAGPSLDDEPPVVWSCDRTERKPETGEDMPLASTGALGSDPDVAAPVAAVDDVPSVLAFDAADAALWARAA